MCPRRRRHSIQDPGEHRGTSLGSRRGAGSAGSSHAKLLAWGQRLQPRCRPSPSQAAAPQAGPHGLPAWAPSHAAPVAARGNLSPPTPYGKPTPESSRHFRLLIGVGLQGPYLKAAPRCPLILGDLRLGQVWKPVICSRIRGPCLRRMPYPLLQGGGGLRGPLQNPNLKTLKA